MIKKKLIVLFFKFLNFPVFINKNKCLFLKDVAFELV